MSALRSDEGAASGRPAARSSAREWGWRVLLLCAGLLLAELFLALFFPSRLRDYERLRLALAGLQDPSLRCIPEPYLLYGPNPGFVSGGQPDHNEQGYRGKAVPLERSPGVARILALGGSTTYGWGVRRWQEAYPAQLEALLNERLPAPFEGAEVINAGLPYGSTAELLTHYHFKFHYYRPDVVIVNTGGNDGDAMRRPLYQPDYGHWRRTPCLPSPLPVYTRWLMRSRVVSLMVILALYGQPPTPTSVLVSPLEEDAPVRWFPKLDVEDVIDLPSADLAFRHNLDVLVDEMLADGVEVLLVPFRPAPDNHYSKMALAAIARNERELEEVATARHLTLAAYPADTIVSGRWVDDAHLDEVGQREKAAYLLSYVRRLLERRGAGVGPPEPTAD